MAKPVTEPELIDGLWWCRDGAGRWVRWDEERQAWLYGRPAVVPPPLHAPKRSRRFLLPAWAWSAVIVLALGAGVVAADAYWLEWYREAPEVRVAGSAPTVTAEPDRVVGVRLACEGRPVDSVARPMTGSECTNSGAVRNVRQVVTVRTADGRTYQVEVGPEIRVTIGQAWP